MPIDAMFSGRVESRTPALRIFGPGRAAGQTRVSRGARGAPRLPDWLALSAAAALVFALALCPIRLWAQAAASVSGVVADASGAVIPGARVVIHNTGTNVEQSTVTGSSGTYSIINVLPGDYLIEVTKDGFNGARETNIVLGVNQASVFNFKLSPGAVQQTVTVTAEVSGVQSSTASLGTVIGSESVNNLPLNGRNFTQLLELTPGVSRINRGQAGTGGGGVSGNAIGQFTLPAVNGQRNRSNMFLLDGVNDLGAFFGNYNYEPIVDDIQEFKVNAHSDLAEFGQVSGGIVSVVTKTGTNDLHGSLWEFLRNSRFDSRNYFIPTVNPLHQNQFGASVGGPVWIPHLYQGRNRTFFFFAYEGFRQSQAAQSILTTPTTAELGGDFSGLLAQGIALYNPFSTRPDPAHPGEYLRDPFPGNQIPSSLLSPAALLYAKNLLPAPNAAGLPNGQNLINTSPITLDDDNYTGRMDQAFGEHDQVFGRISYFSEPASSSYWPGVVKPSYTSGYNIVVHEAHAFGPTSILELHFARNLGSSVDSDLFTVGPKNFPGALIGQGFSSRFIGGFGGQTPVLIPLLSITNYLDFGQDTNYTGHQISDTYEYGGTFTKVLGRHTVKMGGSMATNNEATPSFGAAETFGSFQTSNLENPKGPTGGGTGNSLASFLLGVPDAAHRENLAKLNRYGWVDGIFAQDQIQVNPKLTVNLGVRWDVSIWPTYGGNLTNGIGYFGDLDLTNGTYVITAVPPACSATVGAPCIPGGTLPDHVVVTHNSHLNLHTTDFGNWQGRVGLAYHPLEKTSILMGYGRQYDEWSSVLERAQALQGYWPSVSSQYALVLNLVTPDANMLDPLHLGSGAVFQPPATPFTANTFYFDPNFKTPLSDQWNLELEQGFGVNTVFSLAYTGSHSSRLDLADIKNTAEYPAPGTPAQVASRRQYPYITPTLYDSSTGNSNYNALQATLNKATSNGLTYLLSYTWSKSIDLACSGQFAGVQNCVLQDPYHPQLDRSVSDFDLTNIFSASVVDELPVGRGKALNVRNRILNEIVGGWYINGIFSLSSGTPFTVRVPGDIANTGNGFVQADAIGNPNLPHPTPQEWFNTSALVSPPRYTFGTFGRNALRSDGYGDLDLSVFKTFALTERAQLQFRGDAFNATNSVVFGIPNSTVGSPTFGVVSATANSPRILQFSAKIQF